MRVACCASSIIVEGGECVNVSRLMLSQLQWLDTIVDSRVCMHAFRVYYNADMTRYTHNCTTVWYAVYSTISTLNCNYYNFLTSNFYIPTAHSTIYSFAPYGVHHLMNAVSSEYLYLSCNNVCDWSSKINGAKT